MQRLKPILSMAMAFGLTAAFLAEAHAAGTLDRIKDSGTIRLGVRDDAAPYAFKNSIGESAGYTVGLCRAVVASLKNQLNLEAIKVDYVSVTAENRFAAVQDGKIDLLCGAATATLARRELVDFSIPIFIDGAAVMTEIDGPENFQALDGQKIGVRAGTTTEKLLTRVIKKIGITADIVPVTQHQDGLAKLESGDVSAYFADQAILIFLAAQSNKIEELRVGSQYFSHEPYALAMKRGDSAFRLAVDRALSRIYRTGAIGRLFKSGFGGAKPSTMVKALYKISGLPE